MVTFKSGDQVKLKSGGPVITVDHLSETDGAEAVCVWFDAERRFHRETLQAAVLVKATTEEILPVVGYRLLDS